MKLFCQAIQAVTVEFCGVILVVGMLFGLPAIGLQNIRAGASTPDKTMVAVTSPMPLAVAAPRARQARQKPSSSTNSLWSLSLVNRDR